MRNDRAEQLVLADPDQVMQVVLNIGLNAVQATGKGGSVSLETKTVQDDGRTYCQIEIRDSGSGIAESLREAIFDPFFTTKEKGTGLGLAIAQQIVAEGGGFIRVDSQEGVGSRFLINLPVGERGGDVAVSGQVRAAIE
jgi:signal transduction histidine kinase